MSDLIDRLWERFGSLTSADLPDDVRTVAEQSILDWFGCALAGSREPLAGILRDEFAGPDGTASLVGSDLRADPYRAAMVNGAAGHALDFDDTSPAMGGHPTVPMLPAILALAEAGGRSGSDIVTAYAAGMEIQSAIGTSIGGEHYGKGWHTTATIGVFGSAAASAWMLGLDAGQFRNAMSIAASNASGLKANFGTMTKPLHPGQAAERGLLAARLAGRGFTADHDAIEGNQGFAQAAGSGELDHQRLARVADGWATPKTLFKFHAACHLTHAGIEATKSVLGDARGDDVAGITLTVHPAILDVCGIPEPTTGLEAKFSLRGTQALIVNDIDTAAISTFADGPIRRPEVQAAIDRVTVETDPSLHTMQTRSVIELASGSRLEATGDVSRPNENLAVQGAALSAKFMALAGPIIGDDRADELRTALEAIGDVADATELMEMAR